MYYHSYYMLILCIRLYLCAAAWMRKSGGLLYNIFKKYLITCRPLLALKFKMFLVPNLLLTKEETQYSMKAYKFTIAGL